MEEFVRSTRRWLDRGNPRDAGEADACQITSCLFEEPSQYCDGIFILSLKRNISSIIISSYADVTKGHCAD